MLLGPVTHSLPYSDLDCSLADGGGNCARTAAAATRIGHIRARLIRAGDLFSSSPGPYRLMGSPIKYIYGQDPLAILADIDCVAVVPTSPAPRTAIYGWICIHVESIVRANPSFQPYGLTPNGGKL